MYLLKFFRLLFYFFGFCGKTSEFLDVLKERKKTHNESADLIINNKTIIFEKNNIGVSKTHKKIFSKTKTKTKTSLTEKPQICFNTNITVKENEFKKTKKNIAKKAFEQIKKLNSETSFSPLFCDFIIEIKNIKNISSSKDLVLLEIVRVCNSYYNISNNENNKSDKRKIVYEINQIIENNSFSFEQEEIDIIRQTNIYKIICCLNNFGFFDFYEHRNLLFLFPFIYCSLNKYNIYPSFQPAVTKLLIQKNLPFFSFLKKRLFSFVFLCIKNKNIRIFLKKEYFEKEFFKENKINLNLFFKNKEHLYGFYFVKPYMIYKRSLFNTLKEKKDQEQFLIKHFKKDKIIIENILKRTFVIFNIQIIEILEQESLCSKHLFEQLNEFLKNTSFFTRILNKNLNKKLKKQLISDDNRNTLNTNLQKIKKVYYDFITNNNCMNEINDFEK